VRILRALVLAFLAAGSVAPGIAAPAASAKPIIVVSVLPQSYFAQRITGDRAKIITLVGPGRDPHSYEPTPRQMADLSVASIWFTVGVDFEHALEPKIASLYPGLRIVDTAERVERRMLESHHHEAEEQHEEAGEQHEEGGPAPHVWLGRKSVKIQAAAMRAALVALDPAGGAFYRKNYDDFAADVDSTFGALARELESLKGKPVFVYHPAFGYFLDEFGIVQEAVETGGKEPTQKGLAELAAQAKAEGAKVIFVQAQFPTAAARTLAKSIGGVVVPLDALAPDWLANIARMGEALKKAAR
jgi:zinc transport system substrate-binding protein